METDRVLKIKPLALSILASALAPAAICQEAPTDKVYLEADTVVDDKQNNQMIAEGDVVAKYQDRELRADRIVYNLETKTVRAIGNVRITDPDGSIRHSEEIEVDDRLENGVATQFSAQLPQNAVVIARAVNRKETGTNTLEHAAYTACEVCEDNNYIPTWSLRARKAVQNAETKMISYQDAVFELKGVPVLYMPYFAHPDPSTERRSGFLPPSPKLSSTLGFVYEQPYYWAISPSSDMTITPKLHSKVNPTLGLEYRKRFYSGMLEADVSVSYDYAFDSDGNRQFYDASNGRIVTDVDNFTGTLIPSEREFNSHIFADGDFQINENWEWGFGIERVSDDLYIRRYDIEGQNENRGIYSIGGQRLLSQVYTVRQTENFYGDAAMLSVQGLKRLDSDDEFGVLTPLAYAEQIFDYGQYGLVSVAGSASILNRAEGDDTRRVTAAAQWENSYIAPAGLVLEPQARLRADYYDYSVEATNTTPLVEEKETRTSAMVAATARWPLINRGKNFDMTFEPIVTVAYTEANVDNGTLPNEDSPFYEYTSAVAFEADPFTNFDLIETGGRVAAGFRSTAVFQNGIALNGALAKRWRDEADPAFVAASNLAGTESDYLAEAGVTISDKFRFESNFRFDDDLVLNRFEATGRLNIWRFTASATYFDMSEDVAYSATNPNGAEGIEVRTSFRVNDNIKLLYAQNRNIETGQNAQKAFGLELSDECSFLRISYVEKEISDRGVGSSDTIKFAFGLKTIGQVSDRTFE
jgi:LPS-assembly protein